MSSICGDNTPEMPVGHAEKKHLLFEIEKSNSDTSIQLQFNVGPSSPMLDLRYPALGQGIILVYLHPHL